MTQYVLSIIVPVYNVENYLEKCISSLTEQDLLADEYEILAINDGSTDNSANKLIGLKSKFSNYNLTIINQENQGLSGARNTGLKHASGAFIIFVDSDDILLPNSIKKLVTIAKENNLDILEFGASGVYEDGEIAFIKSVSSNNNIYDGENYLGNISYMGSACNKVYNLKFLNDNDLRFMPRVFIEDIEFNTRAVLKSSKIMAIDDIAAHFLQRTGSITRTKNFDKSKKMIYDIFTVLKSINDFVDENVKNTSIAYSPLKKRVASLVATMLLRVLKETKDYGIKKDIISKLKHENLYPVKHSVDDKSKKMFLKLANNNLLFSSACYLYTSINKFK